MSVKTLVTFLPTFNVLKEKRFLKRSVVHGNNKESCYILTVASILLIRERFRMFITFTVVSFKFKISQLGKEQTKTF